MKVVVGVEIGGLVKPVGLALEEARQIVERVARAIAKHWRTLAKEVGMSRKDTDYYAAAFEHEEMGNARRRS